MFYESLGSLLGQAGDLLVGDRSGRPLDAREAREVRQIGVLLRRARGIWPRLFASLEAENRILKAGVEFAAQTLRERGCAVPELVIGDDPFESHRRLERIVDDMVKVLVERTEEVWADAALADVRAFLAEAAEVQGFLVDEMLTIR